MGCVAAARDGCGDRRQGDVLVGPPREHKEGCPRIQDEDATCTCGRIKAAPSRQVVMWEEALLRWGRNRVDWMVQSKELEPVPGAAAYFWKEKSTN